MQIMVSPGHYVAAVSGGVDSMVLLDILRKRPDIKITVAHLDHGIRDDSRQDRHLVQSVASEHKLPFVYHRLELGQGASEAAAREARYEFLHKARKHSGARALITAHHQDDWLETAVHNMLRGTKRRGFSSLKSTDGIVRPLLGHTKEQLIDYARANKLQWREDSTNTDTDYRRNYIRHNLLANMTDSQKTQLKILASEIRDINKEIDQILMNVLHFQPSIDSLDKQWFHLLSHAVAKEIMHSWLYKQGVKDLTNKQIEKLVVAAKTARVGAVFHVDKSHQLLIEKDKLALRPRTS